MKKFVLMGLISFIFGSGSLLLHIPTVTAAIVRTDIILSRQGDESYRNLVRRAEVVAQVTVQRTFDGSILATVASVMVLGENGGSIAPLLRLQVSRQAWRNQPDPQRWATYFPISESLLRFKLPETMEPKPVGLVNN